MGIHKCVHRLQNNCVSLEMMEGYTFVSTGFWSKFFQIFIFYCLNCFKLFYIFCLIVSNWQLITMCIFCCIFNFYFDNFKHYFLCQDTLLCLGLVSGVHYCVLVLFLFKHFSLCLSFFRLLFFPIIEIFQCPSTENYIQFHNSMGIHYCVQLLSWGGDFDFFIISFTFSFAKVFSF